MTFYFSHHRRAYHRIVFMFIPHSTFDLVQLQAIISLPHLSTDTGLVNHTYLFDERTRRRRFTHRPLVVRMEEDDEVIPFVHYVIRPLQQSITS